MKLTSLIVYPHPFVLQLRAASCCPIWCGVLLSMVQEKKICSRWTNPHSFSFHHQRIKNADSIALARHCQSDNIHLMWLLYWISNNGKAFPLASMWLLLSYLHGGKSQYWASRFAGYLSLDTLLTYEKAVLVWVSWIPFGASVLRDSAVSPALDSKDYNSEKIINKTLWRCSPCCVAEIAMTSSTVLGFPVRLTCKWLFSQHLHEEQTQLLFWMAWFDGARQW